MDHKTLGDIFQEINDEFEDMEPTKFDQLADRVLAAMHKLGSYLMDSKIADWNTQLHHKTCAKCGTKLTHKQKKRQIATWVSDVNYKRYRSYCPKCNHVEYPFDLCDGLFHDLAASSIYLHVLVLGNHAEVWARNNSKGNFFSFF